MNTMIKGILLAALLLAPAHAAAQTLVLEYYHLDALGSVRVVTDQNRTVVRQHDFFPFGEEVPPQVLGGDSHRFTGKPRDHESGLDYFGARHHVAGMGRFLAVDPILDTGKALLDPQRLNRYAYALNAPTRFADPDGRQAQRIVQLLHRAATTIIGSSRMRAIERPIERWADKLALVSTRLVSQPQPVLLGENGDRVRTARGVILNVRTFTETVTAQNFHRVVEQNKAWLRDRLAEGARIYDIGYNTAQGSRGAFYAAERELLMNLGYRPLQVAIIDVNGVATPLLQWVKVF